MDNQPAKFQCCRLPLASFIGKLSKHNDDVIMTSFHVFGYLKISNSVKLDIGYHFSKFQISWLSESNFIEVSVTPPKTIMTSL